jgi:SagB-type dehydrogenase family enzyme
MPGIKEYRDFLKADLWADFAQTETDQKKGLPPPPIQKPVPEDASLVDLVLPNEFKSGQLSIREAIRRRRSRRAYNTCSLTLDELSFLVWATQGLSDVESYTTQPLSKGATRYRTVPSGGARHPFETYLLIRRVDGIQPGLYRYLPVQHKLCFIKAYEALSPELNVLSGNSISLSTSAVIFLWTAIPYRTEWRYGILAAKLIAQDSGHLCQNLYLACEAIGAGTCAVGAYHQKAVDRLLDLEGEDEFVIYMAPVGKYD